jgi:ankyrin repeat protein
MGADVSAYDSSGPDGRDALSYAATTGNLEVITMLIEHGADPRAKNKGGLDCMWYGLFAPDACSVLCHLANLGACPDALCAITGFSIMHLAAERGLLKTMSHIRKLGQNIEMQDVLGETPLFAAVRSGRYDTAASMVNIFGSDVEARNNYGMRPLHIASHELLVYAVLRLLEVGADVNCRDKLGRTPLMLASGQRVPMRKQRGCTDLGSDQVGVVGYLLDNKAEIQVQSKRGLFALHFAAICGRHDVASLLLLRGANVNGRTRLGRTALHLAAASGHDSVIRLLARHGARVSLRDCRGCCALYMACARGHTSAVSALLEQDMEMSDLSAASGRTPLEAAARGGHLNVVRLLLESTSVGRGVGNRALRSGLNHKKEGVVAELEESGFREPSSAEVSPSCDGADCRGDTSFPRSSSACRVDDVVPLSQISEITEEQGDVDSWVERTALISAPCVASPERGRQDSTFDACGSSLSASAVEDTAKYFAVAEADCGSKRGAWTA